jgi:peptide/nickel transport system substrate-binding protein
MKKKQLMTMTLVIVLVISTLLSGCSSGQNAAPAEMQVAFAARYETPVTTWDPSIVYDTGNQVMHNFYEMLLKYDATSDTLIPVLATEYSKSEDGLVWTFKLREGVKFHDGTDFNAEAVKFSIDRTVAGQMGSAYIWAPLKEIKVVDDYTVEFYLNSPVALDFIVSAANAAFIMSPTAVKAAGADFNAQTDWFSQGFEAGTGPYMLQSQVPGDEVIATKFEDYWAGWEGNHFDKVVFKLISEDASRRQMLESGEADVVTSLMVEDIEALKNNPDVQIVVSEGISNMVAYLNTEKAPLNNVKVRQAIAYAFPYEDIVNFIKKGYASVATGIIPKNMWGSMETSPYTYDLEKAKALLAEAGYPDGGFTLTYTYGAGREDRKKTAELFKGELAKIGITLDIQAMPWDSQWAMAHNTDPNQRQDIFSTKYWSDIISPYDQYFTLVKSEETINWNIAYYKNPTVDKLIIDAGIAAAKNRESSLPIFKQIGEIVANDCIIIPEGDQKSVMILSKSFQGFVPNSAYIDTVFFYDCYRDTSK